MKTLRDLKLNDKKVVLRTGFDLPLDDGEITDDARIKAGLKTIEYIKKQNPDFFLIANHMGRPEGERVPELSNRIVAERLQKLSGIAVEVIDDIEELQKFVQDGLYEQEKIYMLENLRFWKEEKEADSTFGKKIGEIFDVYVNDAFGTAHRAHASTTIIASSFPEEKLFGYVIENELKSIDAVMGEGGKPFTAILGGAKVSSKITIIENLLEKVDNLIIGGGMTYTFIKAMGGQIGNSLVEEDYLETAKNVIAKAKKLGVNLLLPVDSLNADAFNNDAKTQVSKIDEVPDGWLGLDIADDSIKLFSDAVLKSKTILWNGPMGVFEMSNFQKGTEEVAKAIAEATSKGAFSLIGGGDSVAAINKFATSARQGSGVGAHGDTALLRR